MRDVLRKIERGVLGAGLLVLAAVCVAIPVLSFAHLAETGTLPTFVDHENLFGRRRSGDGSTWWGESVPPGAPRFRESVVVYLFFFVGAGFFALLFAHVALRIEVTRLKPVATPIVLAMGVLFCVYAAIRFGWV